MVLQKMRFVLQTKWFKKLDFTLLFAKYYLYINKLAPKDLSLDEFKAKISWRYDFENPLLQLVSKYPSYWNNLLISRSNVIVRIITTAVLFFLVFM